MDTKNAARAEQGYGYFLNYATKAGSTKSGSKKILRVGEQNGQRILFAKNRGIVGQLKASFRPASERAKNEEVVEFIKESARYSGINADELLKRLSPDQSFTVKHVLSRLPYSAASFSGTVGAPKQAYSGGSIRAEPVSTQEELKRQAEGGLPPLPKKIK